MLNSPESLKKDWHGWYKKKLACYVSADRALAYDAEGIIPRIHEIMHFADWLTNNSRTIYCRTLENFRNA